MIKLLALDIDDTLTNARVTVPEENLLAIKQAEAAGVTVTLATGRGFLGSSSIWKALNIRGPVINYGGALVHNAPGGEILRATSVPPELVRELFALAKDLKVHVHLYQGDRVIFEHDNPYAARYCNALGLPHTRDPQAGAKLWQNVPKVLFITEEKRAEELIPQLAARYEGTLKVSGSVRGYVEFNMPNAHKGAALAWLAGELGLMQSEVAAMGDNLLDLEMLEWAGLSACVAGGHPKAMAAASVAAPPCAENAVAWFIRNYVLANRQASAATIS